jgi:DNA-directed RNA polymerase subunit RPC12/RpoP
MPPDPDPLAHARCTKCTSKALAVKYCPGGDDCDHLFQGRPHETEHLRVTCERCGYRWSTDCAKS